MDYDPNGVNELIEVEITSNCATSYQRYGSSLGILKNVYNLTMSFCGNEDVYLKVIYDIMNIENRSEFFKLINK